MGELIREAFLMANLPYSILFILVLLYWATVFIGAIDMDFLDFDVDTDVDVDADIDIDADADTEVSAGAGGAGWFLSTASFFNLGQVPFMIFISILILSMWATSLLFNSSMSNPGEWTFFIWFVPNLLMGLFITKILTTPFKGFHKNMTQGGTRKRELVGKTCTISLGILAGKMGQAKLFSEGEEFLLNVVSENGEAIAKGKQAIVVEYNSEKDMFTVAPFEI